MKRWIWMLLAAWAVLPGCKKEDGETVDPTPVSGNWEIGWVDVKGQDFVDARGRVLQLRGINQRVDGLFDVTFDDGRITNEIIPPFTKVDVDSIARLGFKFLRLPINWSGYEPEKDQINPAYIPRIKEVVEWCRQAGIYVQIDWHFDAWSKEIGEDGAPYWTIHPQNFPRLQGPLTFTELALRRASPQVFRSYMHLVRNWFGLRDQYMEIWRDIITAFRDDPAIIGFEPLNEPTAYFGGVSEEEFLDFYKQCSKEMRAITSRHLLWLEPDAARNVIDQAPLLRTPFPDNKVVYCPHYYPNLLQGANYSNVEDWKRRTKKSFDRIVTEGRSWRAPVVINEWGSNPSTPEGKALVVAYREMMEERNLHGAYWLWKEPYPGTSGTDGTWGFFEHLGGNDQFVPRTEAIHNFVVPYALALPGGYSLHHFDVGTKVLSVTFEYNGSRSNPLLYIPPHWYPDGFVIEMDGKIADATADAFHRYGVTWSPSKGSHTITVKPK